MKQTGLLIIALQFFYGMPGFAQSGTWTWVHGDSTVNPSAVYGIKGIANPLNKPPGLYEAINWVDASGNLWIYGGSKGSNLYLDMWKYDVLSNQWTWMQGSGLTNQYANYGTLGIPSPSNSPGSRNCSLSWVDNSGNFWMFGGYVAGNLPVGDLWKFDPLTLEWTWMSGTPNTGSSGTLVLGIPSSIQEPPSVSETTCAWKDSQNKLWFYGGVYVNSTSYFDRIINYNISSNEWTWVHGNTFGNQQPVWGTQGVPSPGNSPGSRTAYAHWQDQAGNFWFMNGATFSNLSSQSHDDVWRYNPVSNEWTWMAGSQFVDSSGNYISYCDYLAGNSPAARFEDKAVFSDHQNRIWMFGGVTSVTNSDFNDLWLFDYSNLNYSWVHGTSQLNQPAVYAQLNVPAPANIPHSRDGAVLFGDSQCHVYLFGGISRLPSPGYYNDVWKFIPDTSCAGCAFNNTIANFICSDTIFCDKKCIDFFDLSTNNPTSWHWLFPGADSLTSNQQNPNGICYSAYGSFDVTLIACNVNGCDTLFLPGFINEFQLPPVPVITLNFDTLFSTPAFSYQWFNSNGLIAGATNPYYVYQQQGSYYVIVKDSNGCATSSNVIYTSLEEAEAWNEEFIMIPNPNNGNFEISYTGPVKKK